jgi:Ca-activated chloride channel family protein
MKFTALLAVLLVANAAAAQEDQHLNEAVSVGYVMVPFTVLTGHGSPITDLRESEIALEVDGAKVHSDLFEKSQNAPVSYTILVDGSGSMGLAGKMESARAAVDALLSKSIPGDDFSVYVFAESEAHEVVPFTDDKAAVRRAVAAIRPFGKTAFFDALSTMPERSRLGRNPTRAVILLSDGIDNASTLSRDELARRLEGVGIPIYPLGLREPGELAGASRDERSDIGLLDDVATLTGGRLFIGNQPAQLSAAVESLEKNLRAQYLIGFTPTGHGAVKYRHISLKLAGRVRSVRVRAGYLGTEPPLDAEVTAGGKSRRTERKRSS